MILLFLDFSLDFPNVMLVGQSFSPPVSQLSMSQVPFIYLVLW